ncbi:MAG: TIGR04282 family arsenosugar biosynthesis glycosyltransferase [Rhodospirillales bacterium]|nr:TIGR04282 family arsenosugar biosynthesis glycosyltransferase [Rhodospirillales bacterium]
MRRRQYLIVFAKAPALGRVKTRLARGIGAGAALAFYRRTLARLLRRAGRDGRWRTVLAVAPDGAARNGRLWPMKLPRVGQGGGDLGARMGRVFRDFPPGPAVIVGADIPDVTAAHVARAFAALGRSDAVFGAARDGGYWLIGLRRGPRLGHIFDNVRWSTGGALDDTLANLRGRRIAFVDTLDDIDDAAAYRRWRAAAHERQGGTR